MQFVSISSDGIINLWTMNKSELTHEHLMELKVWGARGMLLGQGQSNAGAGFERNGCSGIWLWWSVRWKGGITCGVMV